MKGLKSRAGNTRNCSSFHDREKKTFRLTEHLKQALRPSLLPINRIMGAPSSEVKCSLVTKLGKNAATLVSLVPLIST